MNHLRMITDDFLCINQKISGGRSFRALDEDKIFIIETAIMNKEWQYGLGFVALLALFIIIGRWVATQ